MYVTKKNMCFVRKLDDIGRITIPRDVRNIYNLSPGDSVEILCGENDMRIRKHELRDCFFASSEKIIEGFYNITGIPIILCDMNEIVAAKGTVDIEVVELSNDFYTQIRRLDKNIYPKLALNSDKSIMIKDFRFIIHQDECIGVVVIPNGPQRISIADEIAFDMCVAAITAYVN